MLFTMFVYFILWALSNAKNQEENLSSLKEVALNYKDLIGGYKTKWTFDDLEIKSKASKKFSFETYYLSGDPEKINNAMSTWSLISWFILIFISDILIWNLLPRLVNPILEAVKVVPFTNDAIGLFAFLIPIGYVMWIAFIKPRFSRKGSVNTRSKMMAKDMFDIELAVQRKDESTLISRTAAELRIAEHNKNMLNEVSSTISVKSNEK